MHSPLDGAHPVAGNRSFGIKDDPANPSQPIFYIMGIDRTWDWMDAAVNDPHGPFGTYIFDKGDQLWVAIQTNFANWINSLPGGHAIFNPNNKVRITPDWDLVKMFLRKQKTFAQFKAALGC